MLAALALSACAAAPQNQEPLYRGGGSVGIEARLSAIESQIRAIGQEMARRDRAISELDQEVVALKRRIAAAGPAREALRSEAAEERSTLAARLARLESRLDGLDTARGAIVERFETVRGLAREAMAEAEHTRALVNREEAERMGAGIDSASPAGESNAQEERAASGDSASESDAGQAPAAAAMPENGFAVHLASYTSIEAARAGWEDFKAKHPDLLGDREARLKLLDLGNLGGRYLRLLAGPFSDVAPANEVCERLRKGGEFCQVAAFSGDPVGGRASQADGTGGGRSE